MKRTIIKIDEEKCNGCGICVSGCHEGALQLIDGKARIISELYCDGLGACIGECPENAISLEEREAEAYDEIKTLKRMLPKGKSTVLAHLKHLSDHKETQLVNQAIEFLTITNKTEMLEIVNEFKNLSEKRAKSTDLTQSSNYSGCPGMQAQTLQKTNSSTIYENTSDIESKLANWPVQLHLANPAAGYFNNADVLLAADCSAFAIADFHQKYLAEKILIIACPKLDSGKDIYIDKIKSLINDSKINTLTLVIMEVPCCGGLLQLAKIASSESSRKVPIKLIVASIKGEVLKEEWI